MASTLRWWIAGTFTPSPTGQLRAVSGEKFSSVMTACGVTSAVDVPDHLGNEPTRHLEPAFRRPRDFRVADVIAAMQPLQALEDVAAAMIRSRDPIDHATALQRVRRVVGDGRLTQALTRDATPDSEEPPARKPSAAPHTDGAPESTSGNDPLDAIFSKAQTPEETSAEPTGVAKKGLDAFVGAMRTSSTKATSKTAARDERREAATVIRTAIEQTAAEVLGHPDVAPLERAWRGLRMVMAAAPGHDDLAIDLVDADAAALPEALDRLLAARQPGDRPDAVFVAHEVGSIEALEALASVGAKHQVVIVSGIEPSLWGAQPESDAWPEAVEIPDAWTQLRADPNTQWLAVACNPVLTVNESLDLGPRMVTASASLGVATLVSASYAATGTLAQSVGRRGAQRAPAAHDLQIRGIGNVTVPTKRSASVTAVRSAAEAGVIVVAHDRDQIMMLAAPMAGGAQERSLPAQLLFGRASRIAAHVRAVLPPSATVQEVDRALEQAATDLLPRAPAGAIRLQGSVDPDGKMSVDVSLGAALSGAELVFKLGDL